NSSRITNPTPLSSGSRWIMRVSTPSVTTSRRVFGPTQFCALSLHGWRLRGDPTLHPGGCKVSADEGDLDASVATRWQELCRLAAPGVV
ncbi:FliH/SctL family protein, partial [Escherichia coli]|uniref:FliH/SctL family protein n=1 Tax=Escherichia coli TaxID=562 RepID=UPI0039670E2B